MSAPSDEYFAGHFDGEGCIGLYWNKGAPDMRYRSGKRPGCWVRRVSVSACYRPILDEYADRFGGTVRRMRAASGNRRTKWEWAVQSMDEIEEILEALEPSLHEKREQAQLMLAAIREEEDHHEVAQRLHQLKKVEWAA